MLFYSTRSSRRIVHTQDCRWLRHIPQERCGCFRTLSEAAERGYRLCRCCSPLVRQYRQEREDIEAFCRRNPAAVRMRLEYLVVKTPYSKWQLLPAQTGGGLELFHRNTQNRRAAAAQPAPAGYHLQNAQRATILEYLDYICAHDIYRLRAPLPPSREKKEKEKPRKGTRRYRAAQAQAKKNARAQAIRRVMDLFGVLEREEG